MRQGFISTSKNVLQNHLYFASFGPHDEGIFLSSKLQAVLCRTVVLLLSKQIVGSVVLADKSL